MAKITTADFDRLLEVVINDDNERASDLLMVPGVYEVLSEYYNNYVLAAYAEEQTTNVAETEE